MPKLCGLFSRNRRDDSIVTAGKDVPIEGEPGDPDDASARSGASALAGIRPSSSNSKLGGASIDELKTSSNKPHDCPYMHGSVGVIPYPYRGDVHCATRPPGICPRGCVPTGPDEMGACGRELETPLQTLIREALEYQDLYHHEHESPENLKASRKGEILEEIRTTGTYALTHDELQHGARVSWRNNPRCPGRKHWDILSVMDYSHLTTNKGMFDACLEMLEKVVLMGAGTCNMAVFRPQTPGEDDGPRMWNSHLLRFAYYSETQMGDPSEKAFTDLLRSEYGWTPPEDPTAFDVLPLLMQADRSEPPELFSIPQHYVPMVDIRHPEDHRFDELGLKWFGVPIASNMEFSVGGLLFTSCPFTSWHSVTEIVRSFVDEGRYNMCVPIAEKLCYDHKKDSTMFRDQVTVDLARAAFHSFSSAGVAIVDNRTLASQFRGWYSSELETRGYCPCSRESIVPPMSSTHSQCHMKLNGTAEYTLKPALYRAPGHASYQEDLLRLTEAREPRDQAACHRIPSLRKLEESQGKPSVAVFYATVSGVTAKYAAEVVEVLSEAFEVALHNMEDFEEDCFGSSVQKADLVLVLSSTFGPGSPPMSSMSFVAWLKLKGRQTITGKPFAVLGLGDSSYPRFCAAADLFESLFLELGAGPCVVPTGKADASGYEERAVWDWVSSVLEASSSGSKTRLIGFDAFGSAASRIPVRRSGNKEPIFEEKFEYIPLRGLDHRLRRGVDHARSPATVTKVENLLSSDYSGEGRSTAQVQLRLGSPSASTQSSSHSYCAGDKIWLFVPNLREEAESFAKKLGVPKEALDEPFMLKSKGKPDGTVREDPRFPMPNTHRFIMERYVALQDLIEFKQLKVLSGFTDDPKLSRLASDYEGFKEWQWQNRMRWKDIFDLFPSLISRVPLAAFYEIVSVIRPRFYSVSSAPSAAKGEVTLTVGTVPIAEGNSNERQFGFCSSYLIGCQPGSSVDYKVIPSRSFRLPLDLQRPVLMIACGVGIAPFRSFWQELLARRRNCPGTPCGRNILVYGCHHPDRDYLYKEEIAEAQAQGVLSVVLTAFSRMEGQPKQYVQDVIKSHSCELKGLLLDTSAHVYVCGSSNMAQDAGVALASIAGNKNFMRIAEEGRFHEDIFGMKVADRSALRKGAVSRGTVHHQALREPLTTRDEDLEDSGDYGTVESTWDINAVDHEGSTLLHHSCRSGSCYLAKQLLQSGAAPSTMNSLGLTPAMEAKLSGHVELSEILIEAGGALVPHILSKYYPMHVAVMLDDLEGISELLGDGYDPNHADWLSICPIHVAAATGSVKCLELLIENGADPQIPNRFGLLPLQISLRYNQHEAAQVLKDAGGELGGLQWITSAIAGDREAWSSETAAVLEAAGGLKPEETAALQASWDHMLGGGRQDAQERAAEFGEDLFDAIFDQSPETLKMFPFKDENNKPIREDMRKHGEKVVGAIDQVVKKINHFENLRRLLLANIQRHVAYKVTPEHYDYVLSMLLATLRNSMVAMHSEEDPVALSAWTKVASLIKALVNSVYDDVAPES